jgi:hypothetical protein
MVPGDPTETEKNPDGEGVNIADDATSASAAAPRVVIVVARDRSDLYAHFTQAFAGMPDIKVIFDRRIGEGSQPLPLGREQRGRQDIYDQLQEQGFVIIRIW